MFRNLFKPDSALMITMSRITDYIFLSLFWMLCCIPVVTIGASTAALYDASFRAFRRNERNTWQRFFQVFRRNWKAGILPTLVFLLAGWGLLKAAVALWNLAVVGTISWMLFAALTFVATAKEPTLRLKLANGVDSLKQSKVFVERYRGFCNSLTDSQ